MNRRLLVLDTGPVQELINYQAVNNLGFQKLRTSLKFFRDKEGYDRFAKFIAPFHQKTTTTSVIVELHRWIQKTDKAGQPRIWSLVYDEFRGMGMQEEAVKLLEMPRDLVGRYGPTDSSLFRLAEQQTILKPIIVTVDQEFKAHCSKARIETVHLREIVQGLMFR